MNHIMKACIRCNPSGKKEAHKSFLFFLYSLKVNLSWGGKRQPWIRMKIKNILGRYEGRHSRKRGQLGQGTNKNMALFGSRKVIEYDLYIGWRGEGCEITQWEGPYMLCIIVSDFSYWLYYIYLGNLVKFSRTCLNMLVYVWMTLSFFKW